MIIIADSTPLIALARIGRFELLQQQFGSLIIPQAVYDEVIRKGQERFGVQELSQALRSGWITIQNVPSSQILTQLKDEMGAGEAEAITLGLALQADLLLLDDQQARKTAVNFGLNITGTVGILLRASQQGQLDHLQDALDLLIVNEFHISPQLYHYILNQNNRD